MAKKNISKISTKHSFKFFAILLFIFLPIIGFHIGVQYQNKNLLNISSFFIKPIPNGSYVNNPAAGSLIIYSPGSTPPEFANRGFEPMKWYLIPKGWNWHVTPTVKVGTKLQFSDNSVCVLPKDIYSEERQEKCIGFVGGWGFGDRVRIYGNKIDGVLAVDKMVIVSALPEEQ